ncbi:TIM44-like domain-containing protein [Acidobacteriota bacterium]
MKTFGRYRRFMGFVIFLTIMLGFALLLSARVGGGHGYSGRGGSGGGSGGGEIVYLLIHLVIRYPQVGVPVLIVVVIIYLRSKRKNPAPAFTYSSLKPAETSAPLDSRTRDILVRNLQEEDPNFSLPLFLDFAQLLYTNVQQFTGRQGIDKLKVYLSQPVIEKIIENNRFVKEIQNVIIGSCSISEVNVSDGAENFITLVFESNYTLITGADGKRSTYYEYSTWRLARKKGVVSKGPDEMNRIGCTSCGGSLDDNREEKCSYCGHEFVTGADTWYVKTIDSLFREQKNPDITAGYAVETGTDRPTLYQPDLQLKLTALKEKYPDFDLSSFYQRAKHIFLTLQQAWSTRKWEPARPYETDSLFQSHLYWISLYKREKVRNVLQDINLSNIELVKIGRDTFFDSLTVRIYASMIDYTETDSGSLIGGDKKKPRPFSEYWTFIRRAGIKEERLEQSRCPNCGNDLKIGMTGKCEYCGSKITTGEFSWVLSLIEQDESYSG